MSSLPEVDFDVIVAGAGPAGCAVALGLARLGYHVGVFGQPRSFAACEGVSERVLGGLRGAGFRRALENLPEPSPRQVEWNADRRVANAERLLSRAVLDAALLEDLADAGIEYRSLRTGAVRRRGDGCLLLETGDTPVSARFVVDARGRGAPHASARSRGPETVSLLQLWAGAAGAGATRVFAFRDGWAWLARTADGLLCTQLSVAADNAELPKREGLADWLHQRLRGLPDAAEWLWGAEPRGASVARASTAILNEPLIADGVLRVGDAAMAVDPLSGNGIFQALSTATVAPAVINTLLREPQHAALATDFYTARVQHLFQRFARIGRDFYGAETRWCDEAFWRERAAWPDAVPAHGAVPRVLGEALRPVVESGFIRERAVLLTTDQPLGVWRVQGVEIAHVLRDLPLAAHARQEELLHRIDAAAGVSGAVRRALGEWCTRHGELAPQGVSPPGS